jgi:hypothetical protein
VLALLMAFAILGGRFLQDASVSSLPRPPAGLQIAGQNRLDS